MDQALREYILARGRARLGRLRLAWMVLGLCLALATIWLGVREARLAARPMAASLEITRQEKLAVTMDLKILADTVYLAKVRRQALLKDITGNQGTSQACSGVLDTCSLGQDHPCRRAWLDSLERIWRAAYPDYLKAGPPIEENLRSDPWGSPYMLEPNEQGCGVIPGWCPTDTVASNGPSGHPGAADNLREIVPNHLKAGKP